MAFKFDTRLKKGGAILAALVALVGGAEGLRTHAYQDVTGVPTICYGETLGVKMGEVKTVAECRTMLAERLPVFERGMVQCLVQPERIPDKSYLALISFTYNVGAGAFCHSTLVKKLNAGDLKGACNEIPKWNHAAGKVLKGLTTRRATEQALCLEGAKGNAIPVAAPAPAVTAPVNVGQPVTKPEVTARGYLAVTGVVLALAFATLVAIRLRRRK